MVLFYQQYDVLRLNSFPRDDHYHLCSTVRRLLNFLTGAQLQTSKDNVDTVLTARQPNLKMFGV